jgi:hypothetical protein
MGKMIGSASLSKKDYLKRAVSKYQQVSGEAICSTTWTNWVFSVVSFEVNMYAADL